MKKTLILLGAILLVFALVQCSLFSTEIKYLVTGGDTEPYEILYESDGEMTEVTSNNYWVYTHDVFSSDKPQLAFIRVSKASGSVPFTVEIQEDGVTVATDTKLSGNTIELFHVIE
jgi:ABC-type glycerol-3-phosphate transport system substrate-binding protein